MLLEYGFMVAPARITRSTEECGTIGDLSGSQEKEEACR